MGGGSYNHVRSVNTASTYASVNSVTEVLQQRSIHPTLDPKNVIIRESRDSEEHPNSFPIIIALDVTGSMNEIPLYIVKKGLLNIMSKIIEHGINDPQILFLAFGDHKSDRAPLQISQFESSDELIDNWLQKIYFEGNGGGNGGESTLLAWYTAAYHTITDHFEKRNQKGLLITISDEPSHNSIDKNSLTNIFGNKHEYKDSYSDTELFKAASKMYNCYHLNITSTFRGEHKDTLKYWNDKFPVYHLPTDDIAKQIIDLCVIPKTKTNKEKIIL